MAFFNVTLEDSSPLISYSPAGAWTDSPNDDSSLGSYSGSSLHTTSAQGATAKITFNGTGIWLFGGKRPNYGTYTLSIDGQTSTSGNADSANPAFRQLLGGASGLSMGMHTAILTNTGSGSALDIDSLVFESQIGSAGQTVYKQTIDDTQPQIMFSPSDWVSVTNPAYINSTLHYTDNGGASASLMFSGDAVAIYGTVSPDHANFSVSVDGKTTQSAGGGDGLARVLHAQTLLYFANDLGSGQHNLILTANPEQAGKQDTGLYMDIDAVNVYTASGGSGSGNGANNSAPLGKDSSGSRSKSTSNSAVIVGAVAGAMGGMLLLAVILFVFLRRRNRYRKNRMSRLQSPRTPDLPIQRPDMMEEVDLGRSPTVRSSIYSVSLAPQVQPFPRTPVYGSSNRTSFEGSVRSSMSTSELMLDAPPKLNMPRLPPLSMGRDHGYGQQTQNMNQAPPMRPFRPPNLQLQYD